MPESLSIALRARLTPILQRNGLLQSNQTPHRGASLFSVVTTAGRNLLPIQPIPDSDSTEPNLFAAVIYL